MNKKSFTLIELLVVIVIIGIIAAVLVPAMGAARAGARRVQCANNLRQIGVAFYLYLDEHNEVFPIGGGSPSSGRLSRAWENYLYPAYIDDRNVFICHSPEEVMGLMDYEISRENYYGYNGLLGSGGVKAKKLSEVTKPSQTILCADGYHSSGMSMPVVTPDFTISSRHSNGANIIFISGATQ